MIALDNAGGGKRRGMVTTPHHLASAAGRDVLCRGGNAIEAVVAASSALAVVYPHFCGLGGDAVWLVAGPDEPPRCFMGIGRAIAACGNPASIPERGPGSVLTTAALVATWQHALAHSVAHWQGQIPLHSLLQPAIDLAEGGYPATASQKFWLDFRASQHGDWPGFAEIFGPGNVQPGAFRQTALAGTLRDIADRGARAFYEGPLAQRIVAGLANAGARITLDDMASTRTDEVEPLKLAYGGLDLYAPPPPTQGITTLSILGILMHLRRDGVIPGSADDYHLLVEAVKQAFLDRDSIADPEFTDQEANLTLDPQRLRTMAQRIERDTAMPWPHRANMADTAFISAIDGAGRAVSMLQSLYFDWGSGVVAGDTGILWQNRGAAFSTTPGHPNGIRPGKRPFYTLNPGLGMRGTNPALTYGTQGADGQPQTLSLVVTRLLDHGLAPADALRSARFLLGRTFSDSRDNLKLEQDLGSEILDELRARGHEVATIPALSPLGGQAGVLMVQPDGQIVGAHDPRSDGLALAE